MKILIENSNNGLDTKPTYLNHNINLLKGYSSSLTLHNKSIYDEFDDIQPDVYISNVEVLTEDIISYLTSNTKIISVFDVSRLTKHHINNLNHFIADKRINCKFLISNNFNHLVCDSKTRIFPLMECFDDGLDKNISNSLEFKYNFPTFCYTEENNCDTNIDNYITHYHTIANVRDQNNGDVVCNMVTASHIIKNYDTGVFAIHKYLPQLFFHSIVYNKNTFVKTLVDSDKVHHILQKIFNLSNSETLVLNKENKLENNEKLRSTILETHTPMGRTKRLLSQLH